VTQVILQNDSAILSFVVVIDVIVVIVVVFLGQRRRQRKEKKKMFVNEENFCQFLWFDDENAKFVFFFVAVVQLSCLIHSLSHRFKSHPVIGE